MPVHLIPKSPFFLKFPQDGYYNNFLWMGQDGDYGGGQTCSGAGKTIVFNNTIWTPTGKVTECGTSLQNWQSQGNDLGTTASTFPSDQVVLNLARSILGLPAGTA